MTAITWNELEERYGRLLWGLHSAWALISGIAVLVLAHNRYGFMRWVVLFLALTWLSTLFFSRFAAGGSHAFRLARGVVSYLTRVMYQETLFFLIPFYFYSATVSSFNFLYVLTLAALAVLSCFDVLFDGLLREHPWFAIAFFAFVSFSALQFFLPLVLRAHIDDSAYLAAAISFIAALALAVRGRGWFTRRRLAAAVITFAAVLVSVRLFRPILPPVPLRLNRLQLGASIDPRTLQMPQAFTNEVPATALHRGRIYAVATIFSPQRVPAQMQMRFIVDRKVVRASRKLDLTSRPGGFRIWDSVQLPKNRSADKVRIEVWTGDQLLGKRDVTIVR